MTNEEIIEILKGKLEYYNSSLAEYYDEELINALEEANKKIKENTKLKAEIEQLKESRGYLSDVNGSLVRINDKQDREITKLKDELEQLKEDFQTLLRQCSNMEMMNKKYYDMLKKGGLL